MSKKRILIVDDEPGIITTVKYVLEEKGFDVSTAYDGEEGLRKAKYDRPDLVILDLNLPKLIGEEVCREIRKDRLILDTPIIMLTAKKSEVDRIIGRVIGADYYMTKPFDFVELLGKIHDLLGIND